MTEVRALLRALRPCWHSCHSRATSASSASPTSGVTPPLLSMPGGDPSSSDIWQQYSNLLQARATMQA